MCPNTRPIFVEVFYVLERMFKLSFLSTLNISKSNCLKIINCTNNAQTAFLNSVKISNHNINLSGIDLAPSIYMCFTEVVLIDHIFLLEFSFPLTSRENSLFMSLLLHFFFAPQCFLCSNTLETSFSHQFAFDTYTLLS